MKNLVLTLYHGRVILIISQPEHLIVVRIPTD